MASVADEGLAEGEGSIHSDRNQLILIMIAFIRYLPS